MKRLLTLALVLLMLGTQVATAYADVRVRGYVRRDGTYVQPHWRSNPDGIFSNNWSTYPNVNPYTGEIGTRRYPNPYSQPSYIGPGFRAPRVNLYDW